MMIKEMNKDERYNLNNDVVDFFARGFNGEITNETFNEELEKLAEKHKLSVAEMAWYISGAIKRFGGF